MPWYLRLLPPSSLPLLAWFYFSSDPTRDWGSWFGLGFLLYAFVIGLYGCLFFIGFLHGPTV